MPKKKSEKTEENITFEEAYAKLKEAAEEIISDEVSLEKAIECYKEGRRYYDICSKILGEAKQLIQIYDKESGSLKEFYENE